ncbi:MAG: DUF393 domain-containing protein [Ignavibacteriae bacterium]|nr:DUF393 domain-containing protein [Ignavibacteriota bacterium]
MLKNNSTQKIILFDGICSLCNFAIANLQRNLQNQNYKFIPSQSDEGLILIEKFKLGDITNNSIVLFYTNKIYFRSDAILKILDDMPSIYKIFKLAKYLPKFVRDKLYDIIAKYRYFLFGKI